jgi:hypothetical protein
VYQFVSEYENGFFPSEDDKKNVRSQKKRGMYKCVLFLMSFLSYMVKNIEKFPFLLTNYEYTEISEEEIRKIVNTMKPEELFCELVKISMKKAYEMGINIEHKDSKSFFNQELGSDCLQAKRTDLHYPISEYITLHLLALLLNELARRKALKNTSLEAQLEYLKIINRHIKSSMEHHGFYTSEENR